MVQGGCCSIYISIIVCISAHLLRVHSVLQWSFFTSFATLCLATLQGFVYHHWGFGTDSSGAVPWGVWGFHLPLVMDSFCGTISIQGLAWGLASTYSRAPSDFLPSSSGFLHLPVQHSPCRPGSPPLPQQGALSAAPGLHWLPIRGFQRGTTSSPADG